MGSLNGCSVGKVLLQRQKSVNWSKTDMGHLPKDSKAGTISHCGGSDPSGSRRDPSPDSTTI